LPLWVAFVLELWCCNKNDRNNYYLCGKTESWYGALVKFLQGFPFCPYSRSKTGLLLMCGLWLAGSLCVEVSSLFAKGIQFPIMCHCSLCPLQD
jgi:hypothetical protein